MKQEGRRDVERIVEVGASSHHGVERWIRLLVNVSPFASNINQHMSIACCTHGSVNCVYYCGKTGKATPIPSVTQAYTIFGNPDVSAT